MLPPLSLLRWTLYLRKGRRYLSVTRPQVTLCLGGIAASPSNGPSHASAARLCLERAHGLALPSICNFSDRDVRRRRCRRSIGFCVRADRLFALALRPLSVADDGAHCRLRPPRAGNSVWKLKSALDWRKLLPFVVGAALGVPIGVSALTVANPSHVRLGIGVFLIAFSLWNLFRPPMRPIVWGGAVADGAVDFLTAYSRASPVLPAFSSSFGVAYAVGPKINNGRSFNRRRWRSS
jgi:hypothetical protein